MAQYFNARERRQCLEALATLSAEGAKGILTSRPNYFTQSEELQVFEVLYASLKSTTYLTSSATLYLEQEAQVDRLLTQFLDQFERNLRDLTQEQTRSLVTRILKSDTQGLQVVLSLLNRVFRQAEDGSKSLSGKPVIVSYLLQVVEQLKKTGPGQSDNEFLTEWQIYKVIVDQLMIRDLARSSEVLPDQRRKFLQRLATFLSKRGHDTIAEDEFRELVTSSFKREINRHTGEARNEAASRYFSDLRSSTTLTRSVSSSGEGWRFSHNSLREYLVAEDLVHTLLSGGADPDRVRVSDAMRAFTASIEKSMQEQLFNSLHSFWQSPTADGAVKGQYLELLWDGFVSNLTADSTDPSGTVVRRLALDVRRFVGVELRRIALSVAERPSSLNAISFRSGALSDVRLCAADLTGADFGATTLDNVDFTGANLTSADFSSATLFDVNLSGATLVGADFRGIDADAVSIIADVPNIGMQTRYESKHAIGYLKSRGATTDDVQDFYVLYHHPRFEIVMKIVENLAKQTLHQRRGLEQRGAAHADVPFARSFVDYLLNKGLIAVPKARKDMLETTEAGRDTFQKFLAAYIVDERLRPFFG